MPQNAPQNVGCVSVGESTKLLTDADKGGTEMKRLMNGIVRLVTYIRAKKSSRDPWNPLMVNIHVRLWTWRQTLNRIDAEQDFERKLGMLRDLQVEMNRSYWRWRVGKKSE